MPINSILYPFRELLHLFFPERCPACGGVLPEGVRFLCPHCQWDMPLTGYSIRHDNPVARKFWGQIPVEEATSLLFFSSHSRYRTLIHGFKYYGQWRSALQLGEMLGRDLHQSGRYDTVDRVIPIPLHRRRLWYRGYNQSEYLAQGVARILEVPVETHCVLRAVHNRAQATTSNREDRWRNVSGIFAVRHPERIAGKHLLLVDDVLTTGATLVACTEAIQRAVPSCRISIATLSVSAYELFGGRGKGGL